MKPTRSVAQTRLDQFLFRVVKRPRLNPSSAISGVPSILPVRTISLSESQCSINGDNSGNSDSSSRQSPKPSGRPRSSSSRDSTTVSIASATTSLTSLSSSSQSTGKRESSRSPSRPSVKHQRSRKKKIFKKDLILLKKFSYDAMLSGEKKADPRSTSHQSEGCVQVILPWSPTNKCRGENGHDCSAWTLVEHMLREDATSTTVQLKGLMQALLVHYPTSAAVGTFGFETLCETIDVVLTDVERQLFFQSVLPWMKRMVCNGPRLFEQKQVPLLRQGCNERVLFTHEEVVTLLCCGFFSLFPGRNQPAGNIRRRGISRDEVPERMGMSRLVPSCNFHSLFCLTGDMQRGRRHDAQMHKIRCILEYFFACYESAAWMDHSVVEVSRVCYDCFPGFVKSGTPLRALTVRTEGLIEEDHGALQMDFANRWIGGGVLGHGCVQEEIRFMVSPELILSRLVCEALLDTEAVFMSGAAQFSAYTGYADSFRFAGGLDVRGRAGGRIAVVGSPLPNTVTGKGKLLMYDICVVASDALSFHKGGRTPVTQYQEEWITREARKAFVSFNGTDEATLDSVHSGPIATGNWGCGAFGGDVHLKLLIQWCAASEAGREMRYYAFDKTLLENEFKAIAEKLAAEHWTVGHLYTTLLRYDCDILNNWDVPKRSRPSVFSYILNSERPTIVQ